MPAVTRLASTARALRVQPPPSPSPFPGTCAISLYTRPIAHASLVPDSIGSPGIGGSPSWAPEAVATLHSRLCSPASFPLFTRIMLIRHHTPPVQRVFSYRSFEPPLSDPMAAVAALFFCSSSLYVCLLRISG